MLYRKTSTETVPVNRSAVALHTTWDGIGGKVTYAIVGAISIGLLLFGLKKSQAIDAAATPAALPS